MIAYRYKLYSNKHNRELTQLLREACFVWNHCLSLQKRYYKLCKQYIPCGRMQKHFAKRYRMQTMHSQSVQEIIQRLDAAYQRFFKKLAKRPPKFKRFADMTSIVYKQGGFIVKDNTLYINKLKRKFRFSLSRPIKGTVKRISVKKSPLGDFYLTVVTDAEPKRYRKTHDGASVGIDFGLKTYLTLSDGTKIHNPQFLKDNLAELRKASKHHSKAVKGSSNRERRRMELDRIHEKVTNSRRDWQWKLAHELCRKYDNIFIEDLSLTGMSRRWGRKMSDLAHGEFVNILQQVADKYGCLVHKIDRFYPSSKLCECGYKNDGLKLSDREWVCPECGKVHDRDINAARNILRRGIDELKSDSKTGSATADGQSRLDSRIPLL